MAKSTKPKTARNSRGLTKPTASATPLKSAKGPASGASSARSGCEDVDGQMNEWIWGKVPDDALLVNLAERDRAIEVNYRHEEAWRVRNQPESDFLEPGDLDNKILEQASKVVRDRKAYAHRVARSSFKAARCRCPHWRELLAGVTPSWPPAGFVQGWKKGEDGPASGRHLHVAPRFDTAESIVAWIRYTIGELNVARSSKLMSARTCDQMAAEIVDRVMIVLEWWADKHGFDLTVERPTLKEKTNRSNMARAKDCLRHGAVWIQAAEPEGKKGRKADKFKEDPAQVIKESRTAERDEQWLKDYENGNWGTKRYFSQHLKADESTVKHALDRAEEARERKKTE
jgi:hypothetical protein